MNINDLLSRYLNESTDDKDARLITEWSNESNENLMELQRIKQLKLASDKLKEHKLTDKDAAWDSIQRKVKYNQHVKKRWYIAAALGLVILLSLGGYLISSKSQSESKADMLYVNDSETNVKNIRLEDGTHLTLSPQSSVEVLGDRHVFMSGKVFFDVEKSLFKKFKVDFANGAVVVLGTSFQIFASENDFEIAVASGMIQYDGFGKRIVLAKGESLIMTEGDLVKADHVNESSYGWRSGNLVYRASPLMKVLKDLEKHYGINISIENELFDKIDNCKLTTEFNNLSIHQVMDELSGLFSLKYKVVQKNINITNIKC
jgi:transmembrane sensor